MNGVTGEPHVQGKSPLDGKNGFPACAAIQPLPEEIKL
jgi:hypothetical protein